VNQCLCKDGYIRDVPQVEQDKYTKADPKIEDYLLKTFKPTCEQCSAGKEASSDGTKCLSCSDADGVVLDTKGLAVDTGDSKCVCKA